MRQTPIRRGLLLAGLSVALALLAGPARAQAGSEVQAWPGNKAPPLGAGVDAQGKPLLLKNLRGQALVINFWATWCEPCREEMPSLAQLAQSQSGKLRVLAVNFKESPATVGQFVAATGLTLPTLRDPDGALARAWGIRVFPSTVLIGADGQVRSVVRGALDWNGAAAVGLIAPLLPGVASPAAPKLGLLGQR
jgi:thiol-disulfide isomerase/thioredoxin